MADTPKESNTANDGNSTQKEIYNADTIGKNHYAALNDKTVDNKSDGSYDFKEGRGATPTPSNTLTPSQYSSLSEFMNSKGDVDLTPVNMGGSIVLKDIDGNTVSELHVDDSGIAKSRVAIALNQVFYTKDHDTHTKDAA